MLLFFILYVHDHVGICPTNISLPYSVTCDKKNLEILKNQDQPVWMVQRGGFVQAATC